jgi:putative peptide zinc metalloprotease protein
MVFMRTDVYLVLQDEIGSANLYADGSAYLRYLSRKVTNRARRMDEPNADPSTAYPPVRRRAVHVYSVVLLAGTAVCLGVEFAVSLPALIILLTRAATEMGTTIGGTLDGSSLPARRVLFLA